VPPYSIINKLSGTGKSVSWDCWRDRDCSKSGRFILKVVGLFGNILATNIGRVGVGGIDDERSCGASGRKTKISVALHF
jgi:hypothetical protein